MDCKVFVDKAALQNKGLILRLKLFVIQSLLFSLSLSTNHANLND